MLFFCLEYSRTISSNTLKHLNHKSVCTFFGCPTPGASMDSKAQLKYCHKYWDFIITVYCYHFLTELIEHMLLHIPIIICNFCKLICKMVRQELSK